MKIEICIIKFGECDFFFYTKSGVYGMYCENIRHYWFCIPFLIGFRVTKTWGYNL